MNRRWPLLAGLMAIAAPVAADPLDTFGFGARSAGMAGAMSAERSGLGALHANPAGLALGENSELAIGWGYGKMALELNSADADVLDAHGTELGLNIPFALGPLRAAFGTALYLPDQFFARIQLIPATEPHFVLLDNDVHRVVIEVAAALRLTDWLALGVGASILVDAAGNGIHFDVGVVGGQPVGQGGLDLALPTRVAPMFGLLVTPHPRVRIGASLRGELDLALQLGILANVDVAGVVTGDAVIDLRAVNFFTPLRIIAGVAVDVLPELTFSAEVVYQRWSAFHGGAPDVRILIALGITPPLVQTLFPADAFSDTYLPRVGIEWHPGDWSVRAGYAFEPSPVPAQTGLTSFADNERHLVALGGGVRVHPFPSVLPHPMTIDIGLQLHHLRDKLTVKDQALFPGAAFSSGGDIFRAAATLTLEL